MKRIVFVFGVVFLFFMAGCTQNQHFGVTDKAMWVPPAFDQTEEVVARAEKSEGARHCPEKIVRARALGKEAAEIYWACQTEKALGLLADARNLAQEAESCQAPRPEPRPEPTPPVKAIAPPPPPPAPKPEPVTVPTPSLSRFEFDKSVLTAAHKGELDRIARILKDNPGLAVELQGNTDAIGTENYNMALGKRRAQTVFEYLTAQGVDAKQLTIVSHGETNPVAQNETREGRAMNRRVDVVVIK
jgi:outer membrane protein OmpA-like peptidoglycan-associated protein